MSEAEKTQVFIFIQSLKYDLSIVKKYIDQGKVLQCKATIMNIETKANELQIKLEKQ